MHTLLLVEDDANLRLLYTQALIEEGYRVLTTANSVDALALLETETPEIAVIDLVMPGMDGIELLGRLVDQAPHLRVIINTAYPVYQRNYLTWSADAYIVKSSDLTELKTTIRRLLQEPGRRAPVE